MLLLVAHDPEHGAELWRSDGNGTCELLRDLAPGADSSFPEELTRAGEYLYFTAVADPGEGRRLWRSDGTAGGTVAVEIPPGNPPPGATGPPRELTALDGELFFVVERAAAGDLLYRSDGTVAGTELVKELTVAGSPGYASRLTAVGDRLFLAVVTETTGQELWRSDGTREGTVLVREINPGRQGAYPQSFAAFAGGLLFAATDGTTGLELWWSDGTAAGTHRLADLAPGPSASAPAEIVVAGERIFFTAADAQAGREIWAAEVSQGSGEGFLHAGRFAVTVAWKNQHAGGTTGVGQPIAFSDETVLFWFFSPSNLELIVKVLDGRAINGHFWVFYGGLSDVEYRITVTDTRSGATRTYHNPPGEIRGAGDTSAF